MHFILVRSNQVEKKYKQGVSMIWRILCFVIFTICISGNTEYLKPVIGSFVFTRWGYETNHDEMRHTENKQWLKVTQENGKGDIGLQEAWENMEIKHKNNT